MLGIPRSQVELDLRPDFNLDFRRIELGFKPRLQTIWSQYKDGIRAGDDDTDVEFFVNEWFARYRVTNQVFVSYGRENLQWGPSALLSPSNPFNPDNGRNNPRIEVPGLDYARLVWIPSSSWTLSAIANTDDGRLQQSRLFDVRFERSYALKLDYTGEGHYFSVIPSYREQDGYRLGFFAGWNVSDALLLYGEGSGSNESDTSTDRDDFELLMGGAYTLEAGPTLTLEYLHNNNGCDRTRIDLCFVQAEVDPRDTLLRQSYLMFQYVDTKVLDNLNLNLRFIHNIDDSSNRIIGIFEYEVGSHTQLYFIPTAFTGSRDSEFGSLLRYSLFLGAAYTF